MEDLRGEKVAEAERRMGDHVARYNARNCQRSFVVFLRYFTLKASTENTSAP